MPTHLRRRAAAEAIRMTGPLTGGLFPDGPAATPWSEARPDRRRMRLEDEETDGIVIESRHGGTVLSLGGESLYLPDVPPGVFGTRACA